MSAKRDIGNRPKLRLLSGQPLPEIVNSKQSGQSVRGYKVGSNATFINTRYGSGIYQRIGPHNNGLYYDSFSESDASPDTPDVRSEESDSSAGSELARAEDAAARALRAAWARLDCALHAEAPPDLSQPLLLQECDQWRRLVPHLRIVGKKIPIEHANIAYRTCNGEEEVFAEDHRPTEEDSGSEERLSDSSASDSTPRNSPNLPRKHHHLTSDYNLPSSFNSFLSITPMYPSSPRNRHGKNSILKSEAYASKWRRDDSPEDSFCERRQSVNVRDSAKSITSAQSRKSCLSALSANYKKNTVVWNRVMSGLHRDKIHQPLQRPQSPIWEMNFHGNDLIASGYQLLSNGRKVSLPPIYQDPEISREIYPRPEVIGKRMRGKKQKKTLAPLTSRSIIDVNYNIAHLNNMDSKKRFKNK